jgi:hypothetical protein
MLHSIAQVQEMIAQGKNLLLAGSESALSQLPKGNWIGGTIPYFMDINGGTCSETQIFVNEVPSYALTSHVTEYNVETLPSICKEAPNNGFSFLIMPAGSSVHGTYAEDAPHFEDLFLKPVVGWIAGVLVSDIGKKQPKVFNGVSGHAFSDRAVVMHVSLPAGKMAELEIVNVFKQGSGDTITFASSGFSAGSCLVNGEPADLAAYMTSVGADTRLPLTADYNGSIVNVSIQEVDAKAHTVKFYAPVFADVEYKFAAPVADYLAAFEAATKGDEDRADFACNCILNYLYAGLEGKKTGESVGPITFGEVAHQLLNQTLVRLHIREIYCC